MPSPALEQPWYQMKPFIAYGANAATMPFQRAVGVPAPTLAGMFGLLAKPDGGVHGSMRVPPQLESMMPTGTQSASCSSSA